MPHLRTTQTLTTPVKRHRVTAAALLIAGCGGGGNDNNRDNPTTEPPMRTAEAEGSWQTNCNFNDDDGNFKIESLIIEQGTFTATLSTYLDGACEFPDRRQHNTGTFAETGITEVASRGTATNVDLTTTQLSLAFFQAEEVANANNQSLCDVTDWRIGTAEDVRNCADFTNTAVPNTGYTIVLLENDQLFLADIASAAIERPTAVNPIVYLRVQP